MTLTELKVATVRSQTALYIFEDFQIPDPVTTGRFTPRQHQGDAHGRTLSEVIEWSTALQWLRNPKSSGVDTELGLTAVAELAGLHSGR